MNSNDATSNGNGFKNGISVFCIDGDPPFLKAMKSFLEERGINVNTCTGFENASGILETKKFDAIIIQYIPPVYRYTSFLRKIRENGIYTRIIILSRPGHEKEIIDIMDSGADFYLEKTDNPGPFFAGLSDRINKIAEDRKNWESIRIGEKRYRRIFDSANDAIIIHEITGDRKPGRILDANRAAESLLIYSVEELKKLQMPDIIGPEPPEKNKKIASDIFRTGRAIFESRLIDKDGRIIPVEVSSNLSFEDGEYTSVSIIRDTTERDDLLNRLQMVIRGGELGTWDWNIPTGKVCFNDRWAEMLGYSPDEIAGDFSSWENLIYPPDNERVMKELDKHLKGASPSYEVEHRLIGKDGRPVWVLDKGIVTERDRNEKPLRMVGTHLNITKKKEAEDDLKRKNEELGAVEEELRQQLDELVKIQGELRAKEAYIRTVLDNIPVGIAVNTIEPEVKFKYFNKNFTRFFRISEENLFRPGSFWEAVIEDPAYREKIRKKVLEDYKSGDPERMHWEEIRINRKGEKTTYISAREVPLGKTGFVISMVWDVTEQKLSGEIIRIHLLRVKSLLDLYKAAGGSRDEIMDNALDKSIVMTQSRFAFIGFLTPDESGMFVQRWSEDVMRECMTHNKPLYFSTGSAGAWAECVRIRGPAIFNNYQTPHPSKKGYPEGHIEITRFLSIPIFDNDHITAVMIVANKKTEYKDDDIDALKTLGNLMWEIIKNKEATEELLKEKELFWRTFESFQDAAFVLEADPLVIKEANEAATALFGYEKKDMIGRNMEFLHLNEASLEEFRTRIYPYLEKRRNIPRFEMHMKRSNGTVFPSEHSITPLFDSENRHTGWVSIVRDISERIESERREKALLNQIQENMEQLATLNDQIRNPLAVITGLVELKCPDSAGEIISQVKNIDEIVMMLDAGWVRSEKIWEYLRVHYGFGEKKEEDQFPGHGDTAKTDEK